VCHQVESEWFLRQCFLGRWGGKPARMAFLLWLIAVILVIGGIVTLVRGQVLYGLVLIIVGFLVGPGGVSIFT
jgi:hypothetical protein